jgi:hypothetical protein
MEEIICREMASENAKNRLNRSLQAPAGKTPKGNTKGAMSGSKRVKV